jgi:hypothetical protein
MKLSEAIDYIILETGNYLVSNLVRSDINLDRFLILTKIVLGEYCNYRPLRKTIIANISSNPHEFIYNTSPVVIDKINISNSDPVYRQEHISPLPSWRYERPNLYIATTGFLEISGAFDYYIAPITENNQIIDYDIQDIGFKETEFLALLKAKFLVTIGKQRRAFTANDIPFATDASEIVSEGAELWNITVERLQSNAKWWIVI